MEIQREPVEIAGQAQGWAKGAKATGASGFVFLSGSVGLDLNTGETPEGAGAQAAIALANLKANLEKYGTSLSNIMHIFLFVKGNFPEGVGYDPRYAEISAAMAEFWTANCPEFLKGNNPPAMTLIGVTALGIAAWDLEIQVIAAVP